MILFDPHNGVICHNQEQGRIVCEYYIKEYKAYVCSLWDKDLNKYLGNYDCEEMPVVELIDEDGILNACNLEDMLDKAMSFEDFTKYAAMLNIYDCL